MRQLLDEYLESRQILHLSPLTLKNKRVYIERFIKFCDERGVTKVTETNQELFLRYQKELFHHRYRGKPLVLEVQSKILCELKLFFEWLLEFGYITVNQTTAIKLPKRGVRLPKDVLTHEEVKSIFNAPDLSKPEGLRDRAILECLFSTAVRRFELTSLQVFNIKFNEGLVFIKNGKGKKDRVTVIGQSAMAWIIKYIDEARNKLLGNNQSDTLFVSNHGAPLSNGYLTKLIREYYVKAGVKKKGAVHNFRHACATALVSGKDGTGGMNVKHLSIMLGHSSLSSTEIYLNLAISDVKKAHQKYHPEENNKNRKSDN